MLFLQNSETHTPPLILVVTSDNDVVAKWKDRCDEHKISNKSTKIKLTLVLNLRQRMKINSGLVWGYNKVMFDIDCTDKMF